MEHHLNIDLETYCEANLTKTGLWRYVDDPSFEILLFAYSVDYGPVQVIDLAQGEQVPSWMVQALKAPDVIKHAQNAAFEFACLSKAFGPMDPSQWRDTMFWSLYNGFPASLAASGAALGLPPDKQKDRAGKELIKFFCSPVDPKKKANGGRTRNRPEDAPEKWAQFVEYNRQDVVTEMEIGRRLSSTSIPDWIQKQWETDLRIAQRGVAVDMPMVMGALKIGGELMQSLTAEAKALTGLENPNSPTQLKKWLSDHGVCVDSLGKEVVSDLLNMDELTDHTVREMLELRKELGKTSTKKYDAIREAVCSDGRVRGLLQFYGANRTGRWAGRLVQVQNLPRTYTQQLDDARAIVTAGNTNALKLAYGAVNDTLSQLIRTAFVAAPGNVLIDADFSAIEARVISWLAGEEWRLEVFRTHGKIYEASASQMFGIPIERIKKGNPEYSYRARGKVAELALGYQGGVSAMRRMDTGHDLDNLSDAEVDEIVQTWRNTNPSIKSLWYELQGAAEYVIQYGGSVQVKCLTVSREFNAVMGVDRMSILLPSGRKLYYVEPQLGQNRFGGVSITYKGIDQQKKTFTRLETYGGKLVENVVQAIARDCLAEAIENLERAGFPVVFHIHDEVVIDTGKYNDDEQQMLYDVYALMAAPISWAPGLPLNADGWVGQYFKKD